MGRRKKNNVGNLIVAVAALLVLFLMFNPRALSDFITLIFIVALVAGTLFLLFKILTHQKTPTIHKDPFITIQTTNTVQTLKPSDKYNNINTPNTLDKPTRWSLTLLQEMDWKHFEELCAHYFEFLGYKAKMSAQGADEGVDIYLYKPNNTERTFGMVQCKRWKKQVGVEPVRAFFGVQADKKIPLAVFISSAGFSQAAISFCDNKHLKLITGEDLLQQIQKMPPEIQQDFLLKAIRGDYKTPTCVNCDVKMVLRTSKKSRKPFWGCTNYPQCRTTLHRSPNSNHASSSSYLGI